MFLIVFGCSTLLNTKSEDTITVNLTPYPAQ